RSWSNDDMHVVSETCETFEQLVQAESGELAAEQFGYLRFRHAQQGCGLGLRHASLSQELSDSAGDLCLHAHALSTTRVGLAFGGVRSHNRFTGLGVVPDR